MRPRCGGRDPTPRCSGQHARPHEVRLAHLLHRTWLLADGDSQRRYPARAAAEGPYEGTEHGPVQAVQAELVDVVDGQRGARDLAGDAAVRAHLREVAHAPEQAVSDPWRAAGAAGHLLGTVWAQVHVEDGRRAAQHSL